MRCSVALHVFAYPHVLFRLNECVSFPVCCPTQRFCQDMRLLLLLSRLLVQADQLLDMGFRNDIERMLKALPPKTSRQTLLFSATMPKEMVQMSKIALREGQQKFVDTVLTASHSRPHTLL